MDDVFWDLTKAVPGLLLGKGLIEMPLPPGFGVAGGIVAPPVGYSGCMLTTSSDINLYLTLPWGYTVETKLITMVPWDINLSMA